MMPNSQPGYSGFTLIEVLIAMALLSLMSIAIFQITTKSFDLNFRLGNESTDYISIALSLQTLEIDLAQIYSPPLDETPVNPTQPGQQADGRPEIPQEASNFWSAPLRPDGVRRSRVQGTKERITFITNGNRRVEADTPQSDFLKVTWEIERNSEGAFSLFRTTDWNAFDYEDNPARRPPRVALMENLASASFSFYRRETKTWEDQWDSEGRFVKAESRFPDLISLKVEVPDPTNTANQQAWEVIVKPNMRLNPPPKAQEANPVAVPQ